MNQDFKNLETPGLNFSLGFIMASAINDLILTKVHEPINAHMYTQTET